MKHLAAKKTLLKSIIKLIIKAEEQGKQSGGTCCSAATMSESRRVPVPPSAAVTKDHLMMKAPQNWQIGRDLAKASTLLELLFHLPPVGSCAAARQNEVLTSFPHVQGLGLGFSNNLLLHMVEPLAGFWVCLFFPFTPQACAVTVNIVSGFPRCICAWIDLQTVHKQAKRERLKCLTWNMEKTSGTQSCCMDPI